MAISLSQCNWNARHERGWIWKAMCEAACFQNQITLSVFLIPPDVCHVVNDNKCGLGRSKGLLDWGVLCRLASQRELISCKALRALKSAQRKLVRCSRQLNQVERWGCRSGLGAPGCPGLQVAAAGLWSQPRSQRVHEWYILHWRWDRRGRLTCLQTRRPQTSHPTGWGPSSGV